MRVNGFDCAVCGESATALWHGAKPIAICETCAVDVLPTLIADAIFLPNDVRSVDQAQRQLEKITSVYWKAVACRLRKGAKAC